MTDRAHYLLQSAKEWLVIGLFLFCGMPHIGLFAYLVGGPAIAQIIIFGIVTVVTLTLLLSIIVMGYSWIIRMRLRRLR